MLFECCIESQQPCMQCSTNIEMKMVKCILCVVSQYEPTMFDYFLYAQHIKSHFIEPCIRYISSL